MTASKTQALYDSIVEYAIALRMDGSPCRIQCEHAYTPTYREYVLLSRCKPRHALTLVKDAYVVSFVYKRIMLYYFN